MPLKILGSRIDGVSFQGALDVIRPFFSSSHPHHIITGNTLMLLEAEKDPDLRGILEKAALVVPESSGILWASHIQGKPLPEFTPGIDLILDICRMAAEDQASVFLLGSAAGVADDAARILQERYPRLAVVGTHDGYFTSAQDVLVMSLVRQAKPAILFVGMGMPAQEKWIAKNLSELAVPVVMGVGGSFDVLSGRLARAPGWMRRWGIEWAYRLIQEPWRWRRIAQLPVFAWKVVFEKHGGPQN